MASVDFGEMLWDREDGVIGLADTLIHIKDLASPALFLFQVNSAFVSVDLISFLLLFGKDPAWHRVCLTTCSTICLLSVALILFVTGWASGALWFVNCWRIHLSLLLHWQVALQQSRINYKLHLLRHPFLVIDDTILLDCLVAGVLPLWIHKA